jgi:hypothetical protein
MIPRFKQVQSDSEDEDTSDEAYLLRHISHENEERRTANRKQITLKNLVNVCKCTSQEQANKDTDTDIDTDTLY